MSEFFGVHIIIDGYGGNDVFFNNPKKIEEYQLEVTRLCGMKVLFGPKNLIAEPVTDKDRGGITGITVISESHVAIHTFAERGFVMIDIATCKTDIPEMDIISFTKRFFGFAEVHSQTIHRGLKFFKYNPNLA